MANINIDEKEIRKAVTLMNQNNEVFEVRMIYSNKNVTSGYFKDADTLLRELKKIPMNKQRNIYISLNAVDEACYSRQQKDVFVDRPSASNSDNDIIGYKWIMIDLDPKRPKDTSSSDEQVELAKQKGNEIYKFLKNKGFEKPLFGFSGNGIHLLYKVQLANTKENESLIRDFLIALDMFFSDDVIQVDKTNFNPSRVCKLYGSLAMKGSSTEDRPHRMSRLLQQSDAIIKVNDKSYIQKIVDMIPKKEEPRKYNNYNPQEFDLDAWLDKYYIRYEKASFSSGTKYILEQCPFDSNHKGKDAVIIKSSNGAIGFHCFHNSCSDKTWQDIRIMFEPEAYDKKYVQEYRNPNYRNENFKVVQVEEIKEVDGKPIFLTTEQIRLMKAPEEEYIPSGICDIDKKLGGGLKKTYVSVLSGLRAGGKSSVISQILLEVADKGYRSAIFSGELTPKNLMKWMNLQCAGKQNVLPTNFENKFIINDDIIEKMSKWLNEKLYVYNNDYGNDFERIMPQLKKCVIDHKVDLIILDNLMSLNLSNSEYDKYMAQSRFVKDLQLFAKSCNIHILFVAHPRKSQGFLRLEDISGSNDIINLVDNAFIIHRANKDFRDNYKIKFERGSESDFPSATNIIEICKDRDNGTQDFFIPLFFEIETKRLKNNIAEYKHYGWEENFDSFYKITTEQQQELDEIFT